MAVARPSAAPVGAARGDRPDGVQRQPGVPARDVFQPVDRGVDFQSFGRKRRNMRHWYADPDGPDVILLRSPAAAARWLRTLGPDPRRWGVR
jgi:hypothetical protein